MKSELLEQRKAALRYNEEINDWMESARELLVNLNVELFMRVTLILNFQEKCIGYKVLTTDINFYKFQFNGNREGFIEAIKRTRLHSSSHFLWSSSDNSTFIQTLYQEFSSVSGLAICKRCEEHIDIWNFGGKEPQIITNIIDQLNYFAHYFDQRYSCFLLERSPFIECHSPIDMSYNFQREEWYTFLGGR